MSRELLLRSVTNAVLWCVAALSAGTTTWIGVGIAGDLSDQEAAPWILARASGFTSYVLILLLVLMGMTLSHPAARRLSWPSPATRLRIHVSLSVFSLVFTVLHVVVLATDPWAKVGWAGALLPMASDYRPVSVTLGVVAVWAGLVTGVTASLAGRFAGRIWWPIHKVAALILVLVWTHGLFAGSDTAVALWFYVATGALVVALGVSRYSSATPADRVDELVMAQRTTHAQRERVAP
jgi:predicted ferric reductase